MSEEDPLDAALEKEEAEWHSNRIRQRQERWEERVVKKILELSHDATSAASIIRTIKNQNDDRIGEPIVLFEDFIECYPDFPLWIHCEQIPYAFQVGRTEFNGWPKTNKIVRSWLKAHDYIPDDWYGKPFGLAFEMVNQRCTPFFLAHNLSFTPSAYGHRDCVTFEPARGGFEHLYVDNFATFMASIRWRSPGSHPE